jgi:hypothetical protein
LTFHYFNLFRSLTCDQPPRPERYVGGGSGSGSGGGGGDVRPGPNIPHSKYPANEEAPDANFQARPRPEIQSTPVQRRCRTQSVSVASDRKLSNYQNPPAPIQTDQSNAEISDPNGGQYRWKRQVRPDSRNNNFGNNPIITTIIKIKLMLLIIIKIK